MVRTGLPRPRVGKVSRRGFGFRSVGGSSYVWPLSIEVASGDLWSFEVELSSNTAVIRARAIRQKGEK